MSTTPATARRCAALGATAIAIAALTSTAAAGPATQGKWEGPYEWPEFETSDELIATHLVHLPTGEILVMPEDFSGGDVNDSADIVTWVASMAGVSVSPLAPVLALELHRRRQGRVPRQQPRPARRRHGCW